VKIPVDELGIFRLQAKIYIVDEMAVDQMACSRVGCWMIAVCYIILIAHYENKQFLQTK